MYWPPSFLRRAAIGVMRNHLDKLAKRIARNREIGGLHYASDSSHGQNLADPILAKLQADFALAPAARQLPSFAQAVTDARAEWP